MWYMPAIIGIYIILPFLSIVIKNVDKKIMLIPLVFSIIVNMFLPNTNNILGLFYKKELALIIDKSFLGGFYGIYLIMGFYLFNQILRKNKTIYILMFTVISMILTVIYQYILLNNNINYDLWYNNIFLCATSAGVYELLLRIKTDNKRINSLTNLLSRYSLGIFFLHMIVQYLLRPYINKLDIANIIKLLILFISTFFISFVIIHVTKFIKPIQKYLFFVK